jgi:hypothetical protein
LSLIREKRQALIRKGEQERKIRPAEGKPRELYEYWRAHTKRHVGRVNFCHYWRVVVIWAPLMKVRMFVKQLFRHPVAWVALSLLVVTGIATLIIQYPNGIGFILLIILATLASIAGIMAGVFIGTTLHGGEVNLRVSSRPEQVVVLLIAAVCLPATVTGYIINRIYALVTGRSALRFYRWLTDARLVNGRISPLIAFLVVGYLVMTFFSVMGDWWGVPLVLFLMVVTGYMTRYVVGWAAPVIAERRDEVQSRLARQSADKYIVKLDPVLRELYQATHPFEQADEEFVAWRNRYVAYAESVAGVGVWARAFSDGARYLPGVKYLSWGVRHAVEWRLIIVRDEKEITSSARSNQPAKKLLARPFVIAGDFIIFFADYLRVKKWGICPFMEFPVNK